MQIKERFELLKEAETFFNNIDLDDKIKRLGMLKACGLSIVSEGLDIYKQAVLKGKERTEKTLKEGLRTVISESVIKETAETQGLKGDEFDFFEGGFGLAIGILQGDKETIDGLKEEQSAYKEIFA